MQPLTVSENIMCEIHVGDHGTRFLFLIRKCDAVEPVDVSQAAFVDVVFQKGSGDKVTVQGTFLTDGTDGKVVYDTVEGDIDEVGYWKVQGKVTFPNGHFYSDIHKFQVMDNLT